MQAPTLTLPHCCRKARPMDQGTALKPHNSAPLLEPLSTPLGADISCRAHMLFEDTALRRLFWFSFSGFSPPPFTEPWPSEEMESPPLSHPRQDRPSFEIAKLNVLPTLCLSLSCEEISH